MWDLESGRIRSHTQTLGAEVYRCWMLDDRKSLVLTKPSSSGAVLS